MTGEFSRIDRSRLRQEALEKMTRQNLPGGKHAQDLYDILGPKGKGREHLPTFLERKPKAGGESEVADHNLISELAEEYNYDEGKRGKIKVAINGLIKFAEEEKQKSLPSSAMIDFSGSARESIETLLGQAKELLHRIMVRLLESGYKYGNITLSEEVKNDLYDYFLNDNNFKKLKRPLLKELANKFFIEETYQRFIGRKVFSDEARKKLLKFSGTRYENLKENILKAKRELSFYETKLMYDHLLDKLFVVKDPLTKPELEFFKKNFSANVYEYIEKQGDELQASGDMRVESDFHKADNAHEEIHRLLLENYSKLGSEEAVEVKPLSVNEKEILLSGIIGKLNEEKSLNDSELKAVCSLSHFDPLPKGSTEITEDHKKAIYQLIMKKNDISSVSDAEKTFFILEYFNKESPSEEEKELLSNLSPILSEEKKPRSLRDSLRIRKAKQKPWDKIWAQRDKANEMEKHILGQDLLLKVYNGESFEKDKEKFDFLINTFVSKDGEIDHRKVGSKYIGRLKELIIKKTNEWYADLTDKKVKGNIEKIVRGPLQAGDLFVGDNEFKSNRASRKANLESDEINKKIFRARMMLIIDKIKQKKELKKKDKEILALYVSAPVYHMLTGSAKEYNEKFKAICDRRSIINDLSPRMINRLGLKNSSSNYTPVLKRALTDNFISEKPINFEATGDFKSKLEAESEKLKNILVKPFIERYLGTHDRDKWKLEKEMEGIMGTRLREGLSEDLFEQIKADIQIAKLKRDIKNEYSGDVADFILHYSNANLENESDVLGLHEEINAIREKLEVELPEDFLKQIELSVLVKVETAFAKQRLEGSGSDLEESKKNLEGEKQIVEKRIEERKKALVETEKKLSGFVNKDVEEKDPDIFKKRAKLASKRNNNNKYAYYWGCHYFKKSSYAKARAGGGGLLSGQAYGFEKCGEGFGIEDAPAVQEFIEVLDKKQGIPDKQLEALEKNKKNLENQIAEIDKKILENKTRLTLLRPKRINDDETGLLKRIAEQTKKITKNYKSLNRLENAFSEVSSQMKKDLKDVDMTSKKAVIEKAEGISIGRKKAKDVWVKEFAGGLNELVRIKNDLMVKKSNLESSLKIKRDRGELAQVSELYNRISVIDEEGREVDKLYNKFMRKLWLLVETKTEPLDIKDGGWLNSFKQFFGCGTPCTIASIENAKKLADIGYGWEKLRNEAKVWFSDFPNNILKELKEFHKWLEENPREAANMSGDIMLIISAFKNKQGLKIIVNDFQNVLRAQILTENYFRGHFEEPQEKMTETKAHYILLCSVIRHAPALIHAQRGVRAAFKADIMGALSGLFGVVESKLIQTTSQKMEGEVKAFVLAIIGLCKGKSLSDIAKERLALEAVKALGTARILATRKGSWQFIKDSYRWWIRKKNLLVEESKVRTEEGKEKGDRFENIIRRLGSKIIPRVGVVVSILGGVTAVGGVAVGGAIFGIGYFAGWPVTIPATLGVGVTIAGVALVVAGIAALVSLSSFVTVDPLFDFLIPNETKKIVAKLIIEERRGEITLEGQVLPKFMNEIRKLFPRYLTRLEKSMDDVKNIREWEKLEEEILAEKSAEEEKRLNIHNLQTGEIKELFKKHYEKEFINVRNLDQRQMKVDTAMAELENDLMEQVGDKKNLRSIHNRWEERAKGGELSLKENDIEKIEKEAEKKKIEEIKKMLKEDFLEKERTIFIGAYENGLPEEALKIEIERLKKHESFKKFSDETIMLEAERNIVANKIEMSHKEKSDAIKESMKDEEAIKKHFGKNDLLKKESVGEVFDSIEKDLEKD